MKAIVYTYQGEEFRGEIAWSPWETMTETAEDRCSVLDQEDGTRIYLRSRDIRAVITDQPEDVLEAGGPPSSGAAPLPSEPPAESSAPEGT